VIVTCAVALAALGAAGPRSDAGIVVICTWLTALVAACAGVGLAAGAWRVAAIDSDSFVAPAGARVELRGTIDSLPREQEEGLEAEIETPAGRALLRVSRGTELDPGAEVVVRGRALPVEPWRADRLRARGVVALVEAESAVPTGTRRGGLSGVVDAVRERAERALERGMPKRESALARGFVLGQDDRIDPLTRDEFRRSGLAHLLAVSGQNVILLCLLAWPLLALVGLTLRARLIALLGLVALYVPLTGAGPSIQRAGVMGAAGLVAALADRPRARWYALLLAALITLALNPRAAADVGWQLSFAAVIGIFCWSRRLANVIAGEGAGRVRRAAADGVAMTVAATLATAPLSAHHFEALSVAALPANVAALPAVAPAMWLGMLAGIAGQLPLLPVEPVNWLGSLCLAHIAQVARWFGSPGWAQVDLRLEGMVSLALAYGGMALMVEALLFTARRRSGLGLARRGIPRLVAGAAAVLAVLLVAAARGGEENAAPLQPDAFSVRVLDVGQGDAILLDPPGGDPLLVDAGPPGAGVGARLRGLGVDRLAAVVVTHDQSDHAGGVPEVLAAVPTDRLVLGAAGTELAALGTGRAALPLQAAEGTELRSGDLRVSVVWPPRELLGVRPDDPNRLSLVLVAEWRHFSILLSGDAEAAEVPIDPGPVDVIKIAHHGSADEGLTGLLERTAPKLALISVGSNSYGHPAAETLAALSAERVPVARTDRGGDIEIEADGRGWSIRG
jgi:competence protein ComEC